MYGSNMAIIIKKAPNETENVIHVDGRKIICTETETFSPKFQFFIHRYQLSKCLRYLEKINSAFPFM